MTGKKIILLLLSFMMLSQACTKKPDIKLRLTNNIINKGYLGNGVQWDPYDEAGLWGSDLSDSDWEKLYKRLDFMKPGFIRCLINSPFRYYDPLTGKYDKTRNIESLKKLLQYCQDRNITVMFGEYNPPEWSMKEDTAWINMAVDYLNYLVIENGFTCIRYYNLFNEPDGNWSSTNGNYEMWKGMVLQFNRRMNEYPGLSEKVKMAGPDVVMEYKNPESELHPWEWIRETSSDMDSILGLYEIHAYPGQHQVRSGEFRSFLQKYRQEVPEGKKIVLGEAGFKYYRKEDSSLMEIQSDRVKNHPFTKGSDSNMLVYDFFYGLDIPVLSIDLMNSGFSGMAVWMLDDAMHSAGDSGDTANIKIWGMWNILGKEVFNSPGEEEIRPWYYTWSLMCRYFPEGTGILEIQGDRDKDIRMAAGEKDGKKVLVFVNTGDKDYNIRISLPEALKNTSTYIYREGNSPVDENSLPVPKEKKKIIRKNYRFDLQAESFLLITENIINE